MLLTSCLDGSGSSSSDNDAAPPSSNTKPNLILIIADDVGVDQLSSFGFGGVQPPSTPTIDSLAATGVSFSNTWSMPTCSTTRAALLSGRYPPRTNVNTAIVSTDFANSQTSPFERSLPTVLGEQGYVSAYIGKIHVTGSDVNPANHPFGDEAIRALGFDYFAGYFDGGPRPIDVTAGLDNLDSSAQPFTCGFVPLASDHPQGADTGACYQPSGACEELTADGSSVPGKMCLERGGLFDPNQQCASTLPAYLDFTRQNAYYTAEVVISEESGSRQLEVDNPATRLYRTQLESNFAIDWIQAQSDEQPWMLSLGYSASHAPLQPTPASLAPVTGALDTGIACDNGADTRQLMDQNMEAMDTEIRRVLLAAGVYIENANGDLEYNPASNTVVAFIGDNGTYGPVVKAPFLPARSKGTVYQGGIWVPLIVTGATVEQPGRSVGAMVNSTDLYHLFATLGGADLSAPKVADRLDAQPMDEYLVNVDALPVRDSNFSMSGRNLAGSIPQPCVLTDVNICLQLFPQKGLCISEGGTWYGDDGVVPGQSFSSCCAVNTYRVNEGESPFDILAETQRTVRDDRFKLLQLEEPNCDAGGLTESFEFYEINESGSPLGLDNLDAQDLLTRPALTPEQQQHYDTLLAELDSIIDSEPTCPGDGNLDRVINEQDLEDWSYFSQLNGGRSSWYDFNLDGLTDAADRQIIEDNLGLTCL
ncbi:sulfatase-like hydrolase/transferase [Halopseudomonas laoshanensis]|uniref:sulfatase-like hydrolase/transferase n=1 Tax=Halopseudomonas laoshanensis TaxID=2268758 RepID=UPI001C499A8C|nr:sulfatase-like hydrolase/transferase [Halopseudomonas laoshanensis]